jgi:uncharacterized protein YigA (DUF484 family)
LFEHPEVVRAIAPSRAQRAGVIDMQGYVFDRLRSEVDKLRSCALDLIDTIRANMANQTRTHGAVLALLGVDGGGPLVRAVDERLPLLLDVDYVAIGFEAGSGSPPQLDTPPIRKLALGTARRLLGKDKSVDLVTELGDDGGMFGDRRSGVRSAAFALLRAGGRIPTGLLGLGSKTENAFHARQGTDLVQFLARVLERRLHEALGDST